MKSIGGFLLVFCVTQALGGQVEVNPREILVSPDSTVNLSCSASKPLEYCRWTIPNQPEPATFSLREGNPFKNSLNAVYLGRGLQSGDCGITLPYVKDANNGIVKCGLGVGGPEEEGKIKLIVAKTPSPPILTEITRPPTHDTYQAFEDFRASCESRDGRPAANITWQIGDEKITEGITEKLIDLGNGIFTIQQNITRTLKPHDAGKDLVCIVGHFSLPSVNKNRLPLRVKFAPVAYDGTIKQYGVQVGDHANVTVRIRANPKPRMSWITDKYIVEEGQRNDEYGVIVSPTELKPDGFYETTLFISQVTEEDVNREYKLTATNSLGQTEYVVQIDTSLPPKGPEMTAGVIVGIVVAVVAVFILLFVVVFARATGRWCFAGGVPRHAGETKSDPEDPNKVEEAKRLTNKSVSTRVSTNSEQLLGQSSDTESADHGPTHKKTSKRKAMMNFTTVFKKAKDKVAGDSEALKNVTVMEDKDAEKAATIEVQQEPSTPPIAAKEQKEGVVYAELDLQPMTQHSRPTVVVRPEDEKTEYAEIIHTKNKDPPAGK